MDIMPSKLPRVLRLPRLDHAHNSDSEFVLLHVASTGTKPLDIKLIGTENTAVFAVSCTPVDDRSEDLVRNAEAVAKVDGEDKPMTVIIQKRIEGITQRLGTVTLDPKDPEDEPVDIFEWCGIALETSSGSTHELDTLKHKFKTQENEINTLKCALDDLIKAKEAHDAEMLEKFALLLNEKKLKIRDQQRLLASAKIDPAKARGVKDRSRDTTGPHLPLASRPKKRKAGRRAQDDEDDEEDKADKMDVDDAAEELENDDEDSSVDRETEDEADQETEGSDLDADAANADPPHGLIGASAEKAGGDVGRGKGKERNPPSRSTRSTSHVDDKLTTPPRREMPFAIKKSNGNSKAPPPPPVDEGSETESADEL
ncbi:hypothetical protein B7463_g2936, partial [Scytalidium lignicola]